MNMSANMIEIAKTALYFGTFNPIHAVHLYIAETVLQQRQLDAVVFIPSGVPPHRQSDTDMAPVLDRFNMVKLATATNPRFHVSDVELSTDGPSYTVATLRRMFPGFPKLAQKPQLIIGSDALAHLASWSEAETLVSGCKFLQVPRPGTPMVASITLENTPLSLSTSMIDMPLMGLSSSWVRQQVASGQSIRYADPAPVEAYIRNNGLYQ